MLAHASGEGYSVKLATLPGLSRAEQTEVCQEAQLRFDRLVGHGPEIDGWQLRSDGDYQLWFAAYQLDPWLTES